MIFENKILWQLIWNIWQVTSVNSILKSRYHPPPDGGFIIDILTTSAKQGCCPSQLVIVQICSSVIEK